MSRMIPACDGADQRLDELIELTNRLIEQHDELIDIGKQAVAAIKELLPDEPACGDFVDIETHDAPPEAVAIKEPARKRKRT